MIERIRKAEPEDLEKIVDLCEQKRIEYEGYSPYFWRKAPDSSDRQLEYFQTLIRDPDVFFLVEEYDLKLLGFVIGAIITAPPVYAPGGKCCIIDDFNIASSAAWETNGRALLEAVKAEARKRQAVLIIVVCANKDSPKRQLLSNAGLSVSSEWHVAPL